MQIQDKIIFDGITKNATIMRDGIYHYLGSEVGDMANPNKIMRVYRDKAEIEKAYNRFVDLQRLPLTVNHPKEFVNIKDEASYSQGVANMPSTKIVNNYNTLGCKIDLMDQAKEFYDKGIKELSCGWEGSYKKVEHSDYDYTQHFVDFNHIAILPNGRGGSLCSITDNNLNILNMENIEELKTIITDTIKSVIDECSSKKKKKTEDEYSEEDLKEMKKKKKTNDELVEKLASAVEKIIEDKKVDEIAIKDEAKTETINDFDCVLKAIEKGAVQVKDCLGKSPFEIKQLVVKDLVKKDIQDANILDAYFDVSLENFVHPSWNKKEVVLDGAINDVAKAIDNINFLDK
jgi:hypothetical protein